MVIGVLALQGGFKAHREMLTRMQVTSREIRLASDLEDLAGLILPGGESSTMLKLLERENLFSHIKMLGEQGLPILGTCAGAILMCTKVINPSQKSFGFIDATIERNAYGSQRESFELDFSVETWGLEQVHALFIRAPRLTETGPDVKIISTHGTDITGIEFKNFTAVTYHPELTTDDRFHRHWLARTKKGAS